LNTVQGLLVGLYLLSGGALLLVAYVYKEIRNRRRNNIQGELPFPDRRKGSDRRSGPETKEPVSIGR